MSLSPIRLLLLLNLVLAGCLAWLWFDESGQPRDVVWTPPAALAPELAKPLKPVGSSLAGALPTNPTQNVALLERPIFAPDRRPPPPPAPPSAPAAPLPPDPFENTQISGIFTGQNAGILVRVDGRPRRIKINEAVGSWTLKSIEGRDVMFTQGSETRQLRLMYSRLGPPVIQAAAANTTLSQKPAGQSGAGSLAPNPQDEGRERLRRANAIRAANGMPVLSE